MRRQLYLWIHLGLAGHRLDRGFNPFPTLVAWWLVPSDASHTYVTVRHGTDTPESPRRYSSVLCKIILSFYCNFKVRFICITNRRRPHWPQAAQASQQHNPHHTVTRVSAYAMGGESRNWPHVLRENLRVKFGSDMQYVHDV